MLVGWVVIVTSLVASFVLSKPRLGALSESEGSGSDLRPGAERRLLLATDRLRLSMLLLLRLLLYIQKARNESEVE